MSKGVVHAKVNKIVIGIVATGFVIALLAGYTFDWHLTLMYSLGIVFGFHFGPDMDIDGINIDEFRLAKYLHYTLKWLAPKNKEFARKCLNFYIYIIKVWWVPYGFAIPHRSPFSHLPVLADVIRILYFIFSLLLIFAVVFVVVLSISYYQGWVPNFDSSMSWLFDYVSSVFWFVFSTDYWQEKLWFVLGSSTMTFSHVMMDGFRIRW